MACRFEKCVVLFFVTFLLVLTVLAKSNDKEVKDGDKWKKKDIRDYSDADLERLYDQWEDADEDKLPEDELPEWKREPQQIDLSQADTSDPESLLKMSKKGKSLMMFASVSGAPTEKETEQITQLWQSSLFNAGIEVQRYPVGENRVIFMTKDGSNAWDIKDYIITQDRCLEVTIEGQSYPGKASPEYKPPDGNKASKKSSKKDSKKLSPNDTKNKSKVKKKSEKKEKLSEQKLKKDKKKKKDEL